MMGNKMKGSDWKFTKHLPDMEDADAMFNAMESYFDLPELHMSEGEKEVHIFSAAFIRGLKWAIDKYGINRST